MIFIFVFIKTKKENQLVSSQRWRVINFYHVSVEFLAVPKIHWHQSLLALHVLEQEVATMIVMEAVILAIDLGKVPSAVSNGMH
jgi:hypothetical protein